MRVKELLLAALGRANHIEEGTPADAREIAKARKHFNSALSVYSDSNLITAFQRVVTITAKEEQIIGKYNMKRGKIMHVAPTRDELPDPTRLTIGKDFGFTMEDGEYLKVGQPGTPEQVWMTLPGADPRTALANSGAVDYVPDVIVPNIERIVGAMWRPKNTDEGWTKLDFVPLTSFFIEEAEDIYCDVPEGDNKVKLFLPKALVGDDIRLIYNTSMKFSDDDYLELPEVYRELLTLAVTVGLLTADADSDPTQVNKYSSMLTALEHQIGANNVNNRRLVRPQDRGIDSLHRGSFIYNRFRR